MKTLTILAIIACFAVASEMEYRDTENLYQSCISAGAANVYTDTDAALLELSCSP